MSFILKLDLENIEEEVNKFAENLFGRLMCFSTNISKNKNTINIIKYDTLKNSEDSKNKTGFAKNKIVETLSICQIHKQYDFNTEKLYAFYELGAFDKTDNLSNYNFVTSSFNRTNKA